MIINTRLFLTFLLLLFNLAYAEPTTTTRRIPQFSNDKVTVWQSIIFPSTRQALHMHKHEHDRVIVALNNGTLKITNDKGKSHLLKLEKNQAYYLPKDVGNELHNDINIGKDIVKVMVIELAN
jgi:beta-alanine degradation protein BauB